MKLLRRLLFALTLIFVARVYSGSYDSILSDTIRFKLTEYKIPCQFNTLGIAPPIALEVEGLACRLSNPKDLAQPVSLGFYKVRVSPAWRELLTFSPGINLALIPLPQEAGGLSITVTRSIGSGKSNTVLNLNHFPVGSVFKSGVLPGLSVEGELNGKLALNFSTQEDLVGEGNIFFERGTFSASGMERSIIKLPVLREVTLSLPIQAINQTLKFSPITAASSFGVIKGEAIMKNLFSGPTVDFNGRLLLNELGVQAVGGFVALLAGVDLSKPVEEWNIATTGQLGHQPSVKITPVSF